MAKDDDNAQGAAPAIRSPSPPARRDRTGAASPAHRGEVGTPMPEFLSLTYTLPHHLVMQIQELAEETNRSPSEVLADSFRLYLQVRQGTKRRARVSTVNGFAYQEMELSDAVLDEETVTKLQGAATPPAAERSRPPDRPPQETQPQHAEQPPQAEEPQQAEQPQEAEEPRHPEESGAGAPEEIRSDAETAHEPGQEAGGDDRARADERREAVEETPESAHRQQRESSERESGEDSGDGLDAAPPETQGEVEESTETHLDEPSRTGEDTDPTPGPSEPGESGGEQGAEAAVDPGWAALADVDRRSRGTDTTANEAGSRPKAPESPGHGGPDPEAPAPDDEAAAEIRSRLLPLADEPLESDRLRRVLEAIMRDVDHKDFSPPDHSRKVATLSRSLAELKGLEGDDLTTTELAGLLHDIGKACVPDKLIRHIRLTREELAFVRRYPEMGADLLTVVPALEPVADLVRSHQERWDGSGYPAALEGSQIPVGGQIVAVCDIYDTLITERRYRPAYSEERAVQIIRENVGRLWNPDVATPFIKEILTDA